MLFLLVWVIGGVISLFGCVAFAELGSMFPESGGQYVYLREAYGDLVAFLYGWMLFAVANGGSIAALTVAAAAYTGQVFPIVSQEHVVLTVAGIAITRAQLFALLSDRSTDLRECSRTALGRAFAKSFHLDQVCGHGRLCRPRIRHR